MSKPYKSIDHDYPPIRTILDSQDAWVGDVSGNYVQKFVNCLNSVRYRLVYSEWNDWYIIPEDKLSEFQEFESEAINSPSGDAECPEWAKYVELHRLTFSEPKTC